MRRTEPGIAQIAHPPARQGAKTRRVIAGAATVAAHAGLAVALFLLPPPEKAPGARAAPMHVVEIAHVPPPPPPPPPVQEPAPAPEPPPAPVPAAPPVRRQAPVARKEAPQREAPEAPPAPGPVAPAQAGQVLAREAAAPEVLDFSDFDIATGSGSSYVGGITSSTGRNTVAVRGGAVAPNGAVGVGTGSAASRARTVMLPDGEWDCPWPDEARGMGDRVQEVVLRVTVRADGTVTRATLVSDPGHGFGEAALRCARSARFDPALDADGREIDSTSPPIRVRFTR